LAEALKEISNYHSLMAVLSGLNEAPVYRLRLTRQEVPQKLMEVFTALLEVMSAEKSYGNYRTEIAKSKPPIIPYIGVYMRDLVYHDEGLKSDDGRINARKLFGILQTVGAIKVFQNSPFSLSKEEKYDSNLEEYLRVLPGRLSTEDCNERSKKIEPKNAKREDIS